MREVVALRSPGSVVVAVAMLLVGSACSDVEGPFDPLPAEVTAPAAEVDAFQPSISDAAERVVAPVIADPQVSRTLTDELSALEDAISAGNARSGRIWVKRAQENLDRYRVRPEAQGDAPDLSVIELVLDRARQILGMEPKP